MRFAVLDENSSFWTNFQKTLLPRVEYITYKNVRSIVRKAHPRQTAPTAPPPYKVVSYEKRVYEGQELEPLICIPLTPSAIR